MSISNARTSPPYVSYRTFWNFLDGLKAAVPARIDRSFWGDKLSGSTGGQLIAALKYLKLIDGTGIPTLRLRQIVFAKGPQRTDLLRQLANEAYPFFLTALDPAAATYAQLEEKLKENFQIASDVGRKCIKFYINLAGDAGIKLAPFVTRNSRTARGSSSSRKPRKTPAPAYDAVDLPVSPVYSGQIVQTGNGELPPPTFGQMLLAKFPDFDPTWTDEVKIRWFQTFNDLLQKVPVGRR